MCCNLSNHISPRYPEPGDSMILFNKNHPHQSSDDKCRSCHKLQQELARTENELMNILNEVQQSRQATRQLDSLKVCT